MLNDQNIMDPVFATFIDRMGIAAETDGMSPIAGRLYALLLLSDDPRSLDELADALGVSKASVSTDARRLLERGIVERVAKPGDRRDYYELSPDSFARIIEARVTRWRRMQLLANDVRDQADKVSAIVRKRIDAIDEVEASVITPIEQALADWKAERKQAATTNRRTVAKARKR
ncbi:MAG TPA: MarR family transcriptional regulator [Gemmatimonadaceae bacterium]|jgi:DNA-binding transcriptional regulator GbsR (MarR family)